MAGHEMAVPICNSSLHTFRADSDFGYSGSDLGHGVTLPLSELAPCCTVTSEQLAEVRMQARDQVKQHHRGFSDPEAGPTVEELLVWLEQDLQLGKLRAWPERPATSFNLNK